MTPEALYNYNTLMQSMLDTNAAYLGISVGIIIFIGGFIFIFNIKPFQDELKLTSEKLQNLESSNTKLLKEIADNKNLYSEKIEEITKKSEQEFQTVVQKYEQLKEEQTKLLNSIEELNKKQRGEFQSEIDKAEILNEWREHWMWDTRDVPINTFSTLVSTLQKTTINGDHAGIQKLALERLLELLEERKDDIQKHKTFQVYYKNLNSLLKKITKNDEQEIVNKIKGHIKDKNA